MPSHHPNKGKYRHYRDTGFVPPKFRPQGMQNEAPAPAAIFDSMDVSHEDPHSELGLSGVYKVVDIRTARQILRGSVERLFSNGEEHVAPAVTDTAVPEVPCKDSRTDS